MSEEKLIKVTPDELHGLIQNKLQAAGLPEVQAAETANHLVYAVSIPTAPSGWSIIQNVSIKAASL